MSTNMALSGYQHVNEQSTILLSKCPRTWHSLVTNMSTNSPLSGYQNVYEHGTLRLPTCQRTVHYPLSKCQQIWTKIDMINTKINKATIITLAERTQNSGGETTSYRRIQLIANMHLIDVYSHLCGWNLLLTCSSLNCIMVYVEIDSPRFQSR